MWLGWGGLGKAGLWLGGAGLWLGRLHVVEHGWIVGKGSSGAGGVAGVRQGSTYLFLQMRSRRSTTRPVMSVRQIQTMVRVS